MEKKITDELKNKTQKLCVLSTSSKDGKTESSVVGYAVMDDLTIIMSTKQTTRKIMNLKENSSTSFVTGFSFSDLNVQMDGVAVIISSGEEYQTLDTFFFSQNPDAARFKSDDTVFIKFTPQWIRYLDHVTSQMEEKYL